MGQQANERRQAPTEAAAQARYLRTSPQKLNLVADTIRGKKAGKALVDLEFSHRRIARDVRKVLQSAVANAENNHGLDVDRLVVSEVQVGKSIVMKRFHARGRGRGARILKPFSRLTVVVREDSETAKPKAKKAKPAAKSADTQKAPAKKAAAKKAPAKKAQTKQQQADTAKDSE